MKIITVSEMPKRHKPSKYDGDIDDIFNGLKSDATKVYHVEGAHAGFIARIYRRKTELPKVIVSKRADGIYVALKKK